MNKEDKLTSSEVTASFIFSLIYSIIIVLCSLFLITIYIFKVKYWRTKYLLNTQLSISLIILSITFFFPKNSYLTSPSLQLSCVILGSVNLSSRLLIYSITTLILLNSYLVIDCTAFYERYKQKLKIFSFIVIYTFCIFLCTFSIQHGDMIISNTGDCLIRSYLIGFLAIVYFLICLFIQLFCVFRLRRIIKEAVQNNEITIHEVKKIIIIAFLQIFILSTCSVVVSLQYLRKFIIMVIIGKTLELSSGLIFLIIYAFDREVKQWINEIFCCESSEETSLDENIAVDRESNLTDLSFESK